MEYKPYHDLIDQNFLQFNENLVKNQDPPCQNPHKMIKQERQNVPMKVMQKKERNKRKFCSSQLHVANIAR